MITYEGLGLCAEGEAGKLVDKGETTYGGRWVVNPSGGDPYCNLKLKVSFPKDIHWEPQV